MNAFRAVRSSIGFFVAWACVLAALSYGYAFGSSSAMFTGPLFASILVFQESGSLSKKMSKREGRIAGLVAFLVIALVVVGAVTGFNASSNAWLEASGYRPYLGLGWFVLFLLCGLAAFRKLRLQRNKLNLDELPKVI